MKNTLSTFNIGREIHDRVVNYCKSKGVVSRHWVEDAIVQKLNKEQAPLANGLPYKAFINVKPEPTTEEDVVLVPDDNEA